MSRPFATLLFLIPLLTPAPAAAAPRTQEPAPEQPEEQQPEEQDDAKLEAWPELDSAERKQVELEVSKLRKARTDEMVIDAEAALKGGSSGAVPLILTGFAREKDATTRARLAEVMEALTDARHTRLLGQEFDRKELEARVWCLRRAAAFPDPGLREVATAALARVQARGERADPEERYAAALAAVSSGDTGGLEVLSSWANEAWPERGAELRTSLRAVRGPEATAALTPGLTGERATCVAALRMLSAAGDDESVHAVAPYLASDDNQVRVAAINALRGIVDGDDPLEELSVFRAIELAKTWQAWVGR
jgi:hypothetical protein